MEYRFQRSFAGPLVVTEDEVLFFHQFPQIEEIADEDPEFVEKGVKFCHEALIEYSEMITKGVYESVVGLDQAMNLMNYWHAIEQLRHFEQERKNRGL